MLSLRFVYALRLAAIGVGILAMGCHRKAAISSRPTAVSLSTSTIGQTSGVVSEEDALGFAGRHIDAVFRNDLAATAANFDWDTFAERVLEGMPLKGGERAEIKSALLNKLNHDNTIFRMLHQQLEQGADYKLLRIHEKDGVRWALFRLLQPDGGINHHDVALIKSKDGHCRAVDMYILFSGELISTAFKRFTLQHAASQNLSFIECLSGSDKSTLLHQVERGEMAKAVVRGDGAEAIRLYHKLPEESRYDKTLLINRLVACRLSGNHDEYMQTLMDFRRNHPDDACIDALSIDYFLQRKEHENALSAVDAVQKSVGGDPYLDVIRAKILMDSRNYQEADDVLRSAIESEPELLDAWWGRVLCQLKLSNHADTFAVLKETDARFLIQWNELSMMEGYAQFEQSNYHQQWLDYLAQKEQAQPVE